MPKTGPLTITGDAEPATASCRELGDRHLPMSGNPLDRSERPAPVTIFIVGSEPAPKPSRVGRLVATVYDAQAGSRSPMLDGPWWLGLTAVVVMSVLVFGSSPWTWIVLPIAAGLFWLPFVARWVVALTRSVTAFREGLRS